MKIFGKLFYGVFSFFLFLSLALYFAPKANCFITLQKSLHKKHVDLLFKDIEEGPLSILLKNISVDYDGMPMAEAKNAEIFISFLLNRIVLHDVRLLGPLKQISKHSIDEIKLEYPLHHIWKISVFARGKDGKLSGEIDLYRRKIHLLFHPSVSFSGKMGRWHLKKDGKAYRYDSHF